VARTTDTALSLPKGECGDVGESATSSLLLIAFIQHRFIALTRDYLVLFQMLNYQTCLKSRVFYY
jgi:hypothetical protein